LHELRDHDCDGDCLISFRGLWDSGTGDLYVFSANVLHHWVRGRLKNVGYGNKRVYHLLLDYDSRVEDSKFIKVEIYGNHDRDLLIQDERFRKFISSDELRGLDAR
jgi:hypothetical protein